MADISEAAMPETQTTEEGRRFEKEFDVVLGGEKRDYPCYIGGLKVGSGSMFYLSSPIDDTIRYGSFQEPEPGTMKAAVDAALEAADAWSEMPAAERAACFRPYLESLKARRMHHAALVSVSSGMTMRDALVEVDSLVRAIESVMSQAASHKSGRGGVWAVISDHSSPLASPVAHAVGAMVAGNAVVMNPSNRCPLTAYDFYASAEGAGLPGGVLNLVVDSDTGEQREELANDMRLRGVAAVGSGHGMEDMMFLMVDDELRFVNNIGGMSPIVVHRADAKAAAEAILESAFAYSGQRVHSCSKVVVTADDQKGLIDALSERMKDLKVGDPVLDTTFTGPVVDNAAAARFEGLYEENIQSVLAKAQPCRGMPPNYVAPFAVTGLDEDNELGYMSPGLPILDVKVVSGLDEAFEELEEVECGLSAGIVSKDPKAVSRFFEEVDVPVKFVNDGSRGLSPVVGLDLGEFRGVGRSRGRRTARSRSRGSRRPPGRGRPGRRASRRASRPRWTSKGRIRRTRPSTSPGGRRASSPRRSPPGTASSPRRPDAGPRRRSRPSSPRGRAPGGATGPRSGRPSASRARRRPSRREGAASSPEGRSAPPAGSPRFRIPESVRGRSAPRPPRRRPSGRGPRRRPSRGRT